METDSKQEAKKSTLRNYIETKLTSRKFQVFIAGFAACVYSGMSGWVDGDDFLKYMIYCVIGYLVAEGAPDLGGAIANAMSNKTITNFSASTNDKATVAKLLAPESEAAND